MKTLTDTILPHYLAALFWSETDENGSPFDRNYSASDLAPGEEDKARETVSGFLSYCEAEGISLDELDSEQIGHDLCLTQNGHGAGFWDRGLGELGKRLTDAAKTFGTCNLYVGEDGAVYLA